MTIGQLELPLFADERELVRQMELRTYDCPRGATGFHSPHRLDNGTACPGLTARYCGRGSTHPHHRWWVLDETFHWCEGTAQVRRGIENVELPDE